MIIVLLAFLMKLDFMGLACLRWVLCIPLWFVEAKEKKKRTGQLTICAVVKIRKDLLSPLCSNEHKIETHYIVERQD